MHLAFLSGTTSSLPSSVMLFFFGQVINSHAQNKLFQFSNYFYFFKIVTVFNYLASPWGGKARFLVCWHDGELHNQEGKGTRH